MSTPARPPTPPEAAFLDARGLRCPLPVIQLARLAGTLPPGSVVQVLADDPAARHDIPAWGRLKGHLVELTDAREHTVFRVTLGHPNAS